MLRRDNRRALWQSCVENARASSYTNDAFAAEYAQDSLMIRSGMRSVELSRNEMALQIVGVVTMIKRHIARDSPLAHQFGKRLLHG